MYIFPTMLNLGLKEGQEFPSTSHRTVAENCCLCNPQMFTRDLLTEGVQSVISVPMELIELITMNELRTNYNFPT